jgi:hypothetical protein
MATDFKAMLFRNCRHENSLLKSVVERRLLPIANRELFIYRVLPNLNTATSLRQILQSLRETDVSYCNTYSVY